MSEQVIAVFGATGAQGGSVVRYLKNSNSSYKVRAITRNPAKYQGPADEAVAADLDDAASLRNALEGVYGVFLVTNFWQEGTDEIAQAKSAITAAKDAGVQHFVWSSLPDVAAISKGKWQVPHFTHKAQVDALVTSAGFPVHTIVRPPFYFENLLGNMAAGDLGNGATGWAIPIDPEAKVIHMGAIEEIGNLVEAVFTKPESSHNQTLSMAAGLYSFSDVVQAFNAKGQQYTAVPVSQEVYAGFYPGAAEIGQTLGYFADHTYMGPGSQSSIDAANKLVDTPFSGFEQWLDSKL